MYLCVCCISSLLSSSTRVLLPETSSSIIFSSDRTGTHPSVLPFSLSSQISEFSSSGSGWEGASGTKSFTVDIWGSAVFAAILADVTGALKVSAELVTSSAGSLWVVLEALLKLGLGRRFLCVFKAVGSGTMTFEVSGWISLDRTSLPWELTGSTIEVESCGGAGAKVSSPILMGGSQVSTLLSDWSIVSVRTSSCTWLDDSSTMMTSPRGKKTRCRQCF